MKKLIILGVAFAMSQMTFAQNTVSGTVVDKKGNPIPGAKIEVPGKDSQYVLTNMDGTFTIETPKPTAKLKSTYVGFSTTTKKGSDGVVIKMQRGSKWAPDHYQWFVGFTAAFPSKKASDIAPGIVFGRVKNLGWYVKGQFNGMPSQDHTFSHSSYYYQSDYWYDGDNKTKDSYAAGILGGMVRIAGPVYFNLGFGYAKHEHLIYNDMSSGYYKDNNKYLCRTCSQDDCFVIDAGFAARYKSFFLQGGFQHTKNVSNDYFGSFFDPDHCIWAGTFSIGYIF